MNNFDLEKLLSENYCDTLNSLEPASKERFYSLYDRKVKRTKIIKRAIYYKVALASMIAVLLAIGTIGATAADTPLREKINNIAEKNGVHFTDEELDAVTSAMEQQPTYANPNSDNYQMLPDDIGENENGQKYGDLRYNLELMTEIGVDINDNYITGYVYSEDYWEMITPPGPYEEELAYLKDKEKGLVRNWVYVFDEDGTTILGKLFFVSQDYYDEIAEKGLECNKFVTTEEIESNEEYQNYIHDGYNSDKYECIDAEEYEALVKERTNNILDHQ